MALPLFYLENFDNAGVLVLNEETSRHVVQVLRMKKGERLQLTDGKGSLLTVSITDEHKKHCAVLIHEHRVFKREDRNISIAISLLKNVARFEWFLEKATELGVREIIPLRCERTEKQHFRFERMNGILVSAMLQSQQVWLPTLTEPVLFDAVVRQSNYPHRLIAHCLETTKASIKDFMGQQAVRILIGPEGDFSTHEIELALQANYQPVTLGNTRLRSETAGVVAATCLCL